MSSLLFSMRFSKARYLALLSCFFTGFLLLLRLYMHLTHLKFSCLSWPICFGNASSLSGINDTWINDLYHYCSGISSILILILIFYLFTIPHPQKTILRRSAIALIFMISLQILLEKFYVNTSFSPASLFGYFLTEFGDVY